MIRKTYGVDAVRLELGDGAIVFRNPAILDVLTASGAVCADCGLRLRRRAGRLRKARAEGRRRAR